MINPNPASHDVGEGSLPEEVIPETSSASGSAPRRSASASASPSTPASTSTRDRILDASERLFGSHGVDGSSLRGINTEAGTNSAAIHYHFGSKEALVGAVIDRRMKGLGARRIELLDVLEDRLSECDELGAEARREVVLIGLAEACVFPLAELIAEDPEGGASYARFIARLFQDREQSLFTNVASFMRTLLVRFDSHLAVILPHLEPKHRHTRIVLALETSVAMLAGWTSKTPKNLRGAGPYHDDFVSGVVSFIAGGFVGPSLVPPSRTGTDPAINPKTDPTTDAPGR